MSVTDEQINAWYENFRTTAKIQADIDLSKPGDLGRIRSFVKSGTMTLDPKLNKDLPPVVDKGELRQAFVPQNSSGYTGAPKDGATNEWLLAHQKPPVSADDKRALYEMAMKGNLYIRDLNARVLQVFVNETGKTSVTPFMDDSEVTLPKPVEPQRPTEPDAPGFLKRIFHAITGNRAFSTEFATYEKQHVIYEEQKTFYEKQAIPAYQREKRAYDLQVARFTAGINYQSLEEGVGSFEKVLGDRLDEQKFWAAQHYKSIGTIDKIAKTQERVKKSIAAITADDERIDLHVEKLLGPKFEHIPDMIGKAPVYSPSEFNPPSFDPEIAKKSNLTPREIGYVTLAAFADPDVCGARNLNMTGMDKLTVGLNNYYMTVDGFITRRREAIGYYGAGLTDARKVSEDALRDFEAGKPEALGKLLAAGIRTQEKSVRNVTKTEGVLSQLSHIAKRMVELVDKHPELKEAAVKYGNLTEEELRVARGLGQIETIQKEGMMAQDMLLDHAANLIDPSVGKKIPAQGVLGRNANFKAVQRMQAVNYAIASNFSSYKLTPEYIQQKNECFKQFESHDPNVSSRAGLLLDRLDNQAPLSKVYGALGSEKGIQEILNKTTLNSADRTALTTEKEVCRPVETILHQAALTEKMPAVEDMLEKGTKPDMQRVEQFSLGLENRQIQAGGMQI